MQKHIRAVLTIILMVGVIGFLNRHDADMLFFWPLLGALLLALYGVFASSRAIDYIKRHPSQFYVAGATVVVAALCLIALQISSTSPGWKPSGLYESGAISLLFVGVMLGVLPRSVARYKDDFNATEKLRVPTANGPVADKVLFSGAREGSNAVVYVFENVGMLFRIVGPWAAVNWALPLLVIQAVAYKKGIITHFFDPVGAKMDGTLKYVLWIVAFIVVSWLSVSTSAVAWHRYVLENRVPASPLALPDIRVWRYFTRLWLAGSVFGTLSKLIQSNVPELAKSLGNANLAHVDVVAWWVTFTLFAFLASPFCLMLTAIAVNDRSINLQRLLFLVSSRLGKSYGIGTLAALLPFLFVQQVLGYVTNSWMDSVTDVQSGVLGFIEVLLVFAAIAACVTYFSRGYAVVKSADA